MTLPIWKRSGTLAETFWKNGRADFPIYDMHGHMGPHSAIYMKRCEADDMVKHLRRIGVRRLVFSHHQVVLGDSRNAEVAEICRRHPDILRFYVGINPHYPERMKEDLKLFDSWAPYAVGLKFLADYHKVAVTDPAYEYALKVADERALPVLNHTWGFSRFSGGEVMLEIVNRYHRAQFFMGHSIYGQWDCAERCVKESAGNVYLELTAIPGERGVIEMLVNRVGSNRLLYGTDMPWFSEYQGVGGIVSADVSEDDMRNILYRNVEKLLGKDW